MRRRPFSLVRAAVLLASAVAIAAVLAPFVHADRFRGRIQAALQEALSRQVEIGGPVRFRILPVLGFSAANVVIYDDPAIGLEPLAYVSSLDIGVRLTSLWRRRLEFSSLRLVEPSVNLVKIRAGQWNYPPLLGRAFGTATHHRPTLPAIQVRSGRLNFKFGDTKSVFYFSGADLDLSPAADVSAVRLRFAGVVSRTDQPRSGFGRLSGRGSLFLSPEKENRVDMNLHLERSAVPAILMLLRGRGLSIGGFVTSTARLEGPLSKVRIDGRLHLAGVARGFLPLASDRWSLDYTGQLDLNAQDLLLETKPGGEAALPVWVRFRVADYLAQLRWAAGMTFRDLAVDSLPALARELGVTLPPGLSVKGVASGALSWTTPAGFRGQVAIHNGEAGFAETEFEPVGFPQARVIVEGESLRLLPAELDLGRRQKALVELLYTSPKGSLEVKLHSEELAVDRFVSVWVRLTGAETPPILRACASGVFEGSLRYATPAGSQGAWSGALLLRDAVVPLEGFADRLQIGAAAIKLGRISRVQLLTARTGGIAFGGEYAFDPQAARPHSFRLHAEIVEAARLEQLLDPALRRRRRGFLARTFRLPPAPVPSWLKVRRAEGILDIARIQAGPVLLDDFSAKLFWDGTHVELAGSKSRFRGADAVGRITVELGGAAPRYQAQVRLSRLDWDGGALSSEFNARTIGFSSELLANLEADGSFTGRSIPLAGQAWDHVSGCFDFTRENGSPQLRLSCVELAAGAKAYYGYGAVVETGKAELLLFHDTEELVLSGPLFFGRPAESGGGQQQLR